MLTIHSKANNISLKTPRQLPEQYCRKVKQSKQDQINILCLETIELILRIQGNGDLLPGKKLLAKPFSDTGRLKVLDLLSLEVKITGNGLIYILQNFHCLIRRTFYK